MCIGGSTQEEADEGAVLLIWAGNPRGALKRAHKHLHSSHATVPALRRSRDGESSSPRIQATLRQLKSVVLQNAVRNVHAAMSFGSLHNRLTTDVACTCSSPRSHVLGRSYKVSERGIRQHWRIEATSLRQFNGNGSLTSVTTPHSGYHFDGSRDRFFEGWYWKVFAISTNGIMQQRAHVIVSYCRLQAKATWPSFEVHIGPCHCPIFQHIRGGSPGCDCAQVSLGGPGESFAFIYSIEDPKGNTQTGGVGAQACTCVPCLTLL